MKGSVFLSLLLGVVCLLVSNVDSKGACCKTFTPSQEVFLRKLLQDEAKGLRAGMKHALSAPKVSSHQVNWFNLSAQPVCFGARDNQFGAFNIKAEGYIGALKLVHVSGSVTCDKDSYAKTPAEFNSKWGCATSHPYVGKTSLNTVVTTSNNKVIFPKNHHFTHEHANFWYNMEQFDSNSDLLVFQRFDAPLYVAAGQELRLWYGEDLKNVGENDNGGQTCAHIFGHYL